VPPDLADHIRVCLEKDPTKRYPNVQSLAVAIAPFGTGDVRTPDSSQPNIILPRPSTRSLPSDSGAAHAHTVASSPELHRDGRNRTIPGWTTGSTARGSRNRLVLVAAAAAAAAIATVFVLYLTLLRHNGPADAQTGTARGDASHATSVATTSLAATSTVGISITDLPPSSASVVTSPTSRPPTTSTHATVKPPASIAPVVPTAPPSASHKVNPLHL
jgi:hypothetical protein